MRSSIVGASALIAVLLVGFALIGGAQVLAQDVDNTVTNVQVTAQGDARWTILVRTRLDSPEAVAGFEEVAAGIQAGDSQVAAAFERRMRSVVSEASRVTGRDMRAGEFRINSSIQEVPQRWGVVRYSFTWEGFAVLQGDRIIVGDVFDEGFFIDTQDVLKISGPEGYVVATVSPTPTSQGESEVMWSGRLDFPKNQPRVEFSPAPADEGPSPSGTPWMILLTALLLVGVVAAVMLVRYQRGGGQVQDAHTPEEQVLRLLSERDGRLRQAEIAEALGWSASKTSRVTSRMARTGSVQKLQIGRENVISLTD
ncbi:UNVERIFIED_CONTAM: hypothetical protein BEN50_24850 [Euhalothece sp. KZN 001]